MSNRRHLTRVPVTTAIRRAFACPDCGSDVVVNRRDGFVDVYHDDTCPRLAAKVRSHTTFEPLGWVVWLDDKPATTPRRRPGRPEL